MSLTDDLTDADAALLARADWREDPSLTGKQLAERYGRSPRWGQKQRAAAQEGGAGESTPPVPRHDHRSVARAEREPGIAATPVPQNKRGRGTSPAPENVPRTAPPKSRPAPRRGTTTPMSVLAVTFAGFAVVAAVCAVVSYTHIRHLAQTAGMGGLAGWLPLGIDGLVVACSGSLMRRGTDTRLARVGLALGLVGSVAANVLAVDPGIVGMRWVRIGLAVYPPLAVALAGYLLHRMLVDR